MAKLSVAVALVCAFVSTSVVQAQWRLDMQLPTASVTAAGWTGASEDARFSYAIGHPSGPIALGGGVYCGYNEYDMGRSAERGHDPACAWSDEWPDVLADYSGPWGTASDVGQFIVWGLAAGDYEVAVYMRDWYVPEDVYEVVAGGETFTVHHSDYVCGDLSSISDTHTIGTINFDPDGAGTNYDLRPSLVFSASQDVYGVPEDNACVNGYVIVPEPATMALLVLGSLALVARRKRR